MRVVLVSVMVIAGCGGRPELIRSCATAPTYTRGEAGELTMFAAPFSDLWPSGQTHAAAVGPVTYRFDRYESCGVGGMRLVGLDALVSAELTPASLGTLGNGRAVLDMIELDVAFVQPGEGTLAVTVLTENGDEVSDRIAVRVRAATDLAMEITSSWAAAGDAYARDPQLIDSRWSTGRVWPTAADGEVLSGEIREGTRPNLVELTSYSKDSGRGEVRLATAGTGTLRLVPPNTRFPPETVVAIPLEVLAKPAITSSTMTAGTSCFATSGGQAEITLRDGAGRAVRGGGFAVTSSAPSIVSVTGSTYGPDVAPYNCRAAGMATLTLDLPNAPQSKTITVQ